MFLVSLVTPFPFIMNRELFQQLKRWRDEQAWIEGVEAYRILNNATLDALVGASPRTKEELCGVKGIKDAKYQKYGRAILALIAEFSGREDPDRLPMEEGQGVSNDESKPADPLSVSQFLDSLNLELSGMAARLRGEVSSVDIRERVVYFTLKDSQDESLLSCLIFRYQYEVSGIALAIGDEVIVEGVPDIYKPSGRLSLKVGVIEYAGEGELKKAYDALYRKLELAGTFAPEQKRPIPEFAERLALITSREGAAIGDFTMNLARTGFHVDFYPTLVEGKKAVFEIIEAIRYFNRVPERYDALVIIRGGGSLESLQAFNTEALVHEISVSRIPVLAGIGHERDVSLAALASDAMVSTPTAAARYLSASWDEARSSLGKHVLALARAMQEFRTLVRERIQRGEESLRRALSDILERVGMAQAAFREAVALFPEYCRRVASQLESDAALWQARTAAAATNARDRLSDIEARLRQYDPVRALQLGYSLVRKEGKVIRGIAGVSVGDRINIQLGRGGIESEVIGITE